jgi:hypothetical protein
MKIIYQIGHFKVVEQHRILASPKPGMRQSWTEYQVRDGRRMLSRHDLERRAIDDAEKRANAHWRAIEAEAKRLEAMGA